MCVGEASLTLLPLCQPPLHARTELVRKAISWRVPGCKRLEQLHPAGCALVE